METTDFEGCVNGSNTISDLGLKSLNLYPNPAISSFTLQLNEPSEGNAIIRLIDTSGTKVMEFQSPNTGNGLYNVVPVNKLEAGVYVVQVLLNQKDLYASKIVVIK